MFHILWTKRLVWNHDGDLMAGLPQCAASAAPCSPSCSSRCFLDTMRLSKCVTLILIISIVEIVDVVLIKRRWHCRPIVHSPSSLYWRFANWIIGTKQDYISWTRPLHGSSAHENISVIIKWVLLRLLSVAAASTVGIAHSKCTFKTEDVLFCSRAAVSIVLRWQLTHVSSSQLKTQPCYVQLFLISHCLCQRDDQDSIWLLVGNIIPKTKQPFNDMHRICNRHWAPCIGQHLCLTMCSWSIDIWMCLCVFIAWQLCDHYSP